MESRKHKAGASDGALRKPDWNRHNVKFRRRAARAEKRKFSDRIPVAMIALVLSCFSTVFATISFQQQSTYSSISQQYQVFSDLTKLPNTEPNISHLIAMPDKYEVVKRLVEKSSGDMTEADLARAEIKERFVANLIFTIFEQRLYDHNRASMPLFNSEKRAFSQAVLNYFTGRVLRNPRLLWYWDENGGGLSTYYEADTKKYYEEHVLKDKNIPLKEVPDKVGPFGRRKS